MNKKTSAKPSQSTTNLLDKALQGLSIHLALKQGSLLLNSPLEAEILLSWTLNKNRAYLFAHPEECLNRIQLEHYQQNLKQRLDGKPIAYITGHREFWSLALKVNPNCLIPRHETERLVELALELIPNEDIIQILDLGTGSGAIALALAKERPQWQIDACDISEEALELAKTNAKNNQITNLSFYHSNWFQHIPKKRYHAILANPPYITDQDPQLVQGDLRFEPRQALLSGQDGLADLHYIISNSGNYLLANGLLLLEHGFDQKFAIGTILKRLGYRNIQCWQDLQGHDRVSGGWFPEI